MRPVQTNSIDPFGSNRVDHSNPADRDVKTQRTPKALPTEVLGPWVTQDVEPDWHFPHESGDMA